MLISVHIATQNCAKHLDYSGPSLTSNLLWTFGTLTLEIICIYFLQENDLPLLRLLQITWTNFLQQFSMPHITTALL
jgi:hypothetical protein